MWQAYLVVKKKFCTDGPLTSFSRIQRCLFLARNWVFNHSIWNVTILWIFFVRFFCEQIWNKIPIKTPPRPQIAIFFHLFFIFWFFFHRMCERERERERERFICSCQSCISNCFEIIFMAAFLYDNLYPNNKTNK